MGNWTIHKRVAAAGALLLAAAVTNARGTEKADDGWPFADRPAEGVRLFEDAANIGLCNARVGVLFRRSDGALLGLWSAADGLCAVNVDDKGTVRTELWSLELLPQGSTNPCVAKAGSTNLLWTSSGSATRRELCGPTSVVQHSRTSAATSYLLYSASASASPSVSGSGWVKGMGLLTTLSPLNFSHLFRPIEGIFTPCGPIFGAGGRSMGRIGRTSCVFQPVRDTAKSDKGASIKSLEG